MVKYCCAFNCRTEYISGSTIKFHSFPMKDLEILGKWVHAVRRERLKPNKYTVIYSQQFRSSDYCTDSEIMLMKKDAVPSIFDYPKHLQKNETTRRVLIRNESTASLENDIAIDLDIPCQSPADDFCKSTITQTTLTGSMLKQTITQLRRDKKVLQQLKQGNRRITTLQAIWKLHKTQGHGSKDLEQAISNNFNKLPFVLSQNKLKNSRKCKSHFRYLNELKSFFLTLYFYYSRAYRFLHKWSTLIYRKEIVILEFCTKY